MIEGLKPAYNTALRPMARLFIAWGIHPNYITASSLVFCALSALETARSHWIIALLWGCAGSFIDGFDGLVARESGKITTFGAILDSSLDRVAEIFWFAGMIYWYCGKTLWGVLNGGIFLSFAALSASFLIPYIKARCEGAGLVCKSGIMQRPERLIIIGLGLLCGPIVMPWALLIIAIVGHITVIERFVVAWREGGKKDRKEKQISNIERRISNSEGRIS
jgi:CDP-diacylglycerol--glycerol-3-phosphate 3-phosphatidyltransferase